MNSMSDQHTQGDLEMVFLYVLKALPSREMARVEAHISRCDRCHKEMETLLPAAELLVGWTSPELPPASLWQRLALRIAEDTGGEPLMTPARMSIGPEWEGAAPGIDVKLLSINTATQQICILVRLAPGTDYPSHRHAGVEELYLLEGVLIIDDKTLYPGDYFRAEVGSVDHRVWSRTGCTCILLTSTQDEIL
jgi:hypothetical protein